jgi:hypothetical protein
MQRDWSAITRRWLSRLSFSFFVIGFFLAWEGYKRYTFIGRSVDDWRMLLYLFAAMLSFVLGFTGVRERHRGE